MVYTDAEHGGGSGLEFDLNDTAEEEEVQSQELVCYIRQAGDHIRDVVEEDPNRESSSFILGASGTY